MPFADKSLIQLPDITAWDTIKEDEMSPRHKPQNNAGTQLATA